MAGELHGLRRKPIGDVNAGSELRDRYQVHKEIRKGCMSKKVADGVWEMLAKAGVKRCYGIVGDALNPVVDALRRNGAIEFVSVRHEEYGVFAAVAEAYFTGNPVAVCGTAARRLSVMWESSEHTARLSLH